jgi:hypothetical protein
MTKEQYAVYLKAFNKRENASKGLDENGLPFGQADLQGALSHDPFQGALQTAAVNAAPDYHAYQGFNNQSRDSQNDTIQRLHQLAMGDANSPSQQMLKEQTQAAQSQAASLGAAQKGRGAGAALRNIGANQNQLQGQQIGQSHILMLQEQQQAQQELLNMLQQQHGQDIGMAMGTAQESLGNTSEADRNWQQLMQAAAQNYGGDMNTQQGLASALVGLNLGQSQINANGANMLIGAGASGAGAINRAFSGGGGQPANGPSGVNSGNGYYGPISPYNDPYGDTTSIWDQYDSGAPSKLNDDGETYGTNSGQGGYT